VSDLATPILTPDHRVRVFISSTLTELSAERSAARRAVDHLHLTPVMFEQGARTHPPRDLYRSYVAQSDVFVGIYAQSYGWVAPNETVSGLEDEYLASGDRPKLLYVKAAQERTPRLRALLDRVQVDDLASYKHFETPEALTELLADDLAVLLTERFAAADDRGVPTGDALHGLPTPPTAIIGRDVELAEVTDLLRGETVHLVTLLGPGGIGKTRLAVEVASRLQENAAFDSVCFVDLAALTDPADWAQTLATALGARPTGSRPVIDVVIDSLQDRRTLLVLDNYEHLLTTVHELGRLLAACGGLTVLVTSRIVLRLRGEREYPLAPLATPADTAELDLQSVLRSPAVRLLQARAQDVRPRFAVTEENAEAVAELSRRLDGVPLALELVAAQLRLMTPHTVLLRLRDRVTGPLNLAPGQVDLPDRQLTLRATIDWSHSLLSDAEKTLLARISVISAPWTLAEAEAVGPIDGDLDVITTLGSLVSQSLVSSDDSDAEDPAFRLLETIREYAAERLDARDGFDDAMGRLANYLLCVVADVGLALEGPGNVAAAYQIDRRIGDLRATTAWALDRDDAETVVRLGAPLFSYWWSRGLLPHTFPLAERVSALPSADRLTAEGADLLLWGRGMALAAVGKTARAEPLLGNLVKSTRERGGRLHAHALFGLALTQIDDRPAQAMDSLDRAAEEFRAQHLDWGLSITLSTRGGLALVAGDPVTAMSMHREALAAAERAGNDHLRAQVLDMLGLDAAAVGAVAAARGHHARAAALHTRLLDQEGSAYGLAGFAALALRQGRPEAAARLLAASSHALEAVGVAIWPGMRANLAALTRETSESVSSTDLVLANEEGTRLTLADAFEYALAVTSETPSP
jgi:predicted ATPase